MRASVVLIGAFVTGVVTLGTVGTPSAVGNTVVAIGVGTAPVIAVGTGAFTFAASVVVIRASFFVVAELCCMKKSNSFYFLRYSNHQIG